MAEWHLSDTSAWRHSLVPRTAHEGSQTQTALWEWVTREHINSLSICQTRYLVSTTSSCSAERQTGTELIIHPLPVGSAKHRASLAAAVGSPAAAAAAAGYQQPTDSTQLEIQRLASSLVVSLAQSCLLHYPASDTFLHVIANWQ